MNLEAFFAALRRRDSGVSFAEYETNVSPA